MLEYDEDYKKPPKLPPQQPVSNRVSNTAKFVEFEPQIESKRTNYGIENKFKVLEQIDVI